jgi:hypothetical protein
MYVYARPPSVAATDQVVQIDFSSESEPYPGWTETLIMSSEPLLVEVAYSDVAGRQESTTHIVIEKNPSGRYRATRVDLDATPRFTDRADPPSLH